MCARKNVCLEKVNRQFFHYFAVFRTCCCYSRHTHTYTFETIWKGENRTWAFSPIVRTKIETHTCLCECEGKTQGWKRTNEPTSERTHGGCGPRNESSATKIKTNVWATVTLSVTGLSATGANEDICAYVHVCIYGNVHSRHECCTPIHITNESRFRVPVRPV